MKRKELEAIKRRAEVIADKTIGQGHAGTNERLFSDWAHQQACEVSMLVAEVEKLGGWLRRLYYDYDYLTDDEIKEIREYVALLFLVSPEEE